MTAEAPNLAARRTLNLSLAACERIVAAAKDTSPVTGLTHTHYKYPARFSPIFVKAIIGELTNKGDLVLDPFVGGGTTIVESLSAGRNCIGVDISSLAIFVSEAKTLLLNDDELGIVRAWAKAVPGKINMQGHAIDFAQGQHEGYYRNIESKGFWRLRKAIEQSLGCVIPLAGNAEILARCVVLKTAQWALDARRNLPSISAYRSMLSANAASMIEGAIAFREAVASSGETVKSLCYNRSAVGIEEIPEVCQQGSPRLVLTSPPYPGIHVLYHRWQVDGRKETPAPFLIANRLDGSGESYYTLGHRRNPELKTYFDSLTGVLNSVSALANSDTTFVQMVAFSEPEWQLPRYLEVCEAAGLTEVFLPNSSSEDGRLRRVVPGRRWHADQMGSIPASQEIVLFHKLASVTPPDQPDHFVRGRRSPAPLGSES